MRTALCDKLGITIPIILAPMGGAVGPQLAAAVCNAGGLGTLPLWGADIKTRQPAAKIVLEIHDEASAILKRLGTMPG